MTFIVGLALSFVACRYLGVWRWFVTPLVAERKE